MYRLHVVIATALLAIVQLGLPRARAQTVTTYSTSFETSADFSGWQPWYPIAPQVGSYGPNALFQANNHPHTGLYCARQEQGQPGWWGSMRVEPSLDNTEDSIIDLSVWQFEDFAHGAPYFVPPQHIDHDQDQGWLVIMDGDGSIQPGVSEFFALGVHAYWNSPSPYLDWWQHYSYGTQVDGWKTSTFPRAQGFHQLRIVVKPFTGAADDVEFHINGQKVGTGHRQPGPNAAQPRGVQLTTLGLGANHTLMINSPGSLPGTDLLDYIANTYEFFYYDDLQLNLTHVDPCPHHPRFDADGDADVDLDDFAAFQRCYTGPGGAGFNFTACRCLDADGDAAIGPADLNAFVACATRAGVPANPACDSALPPP